MKAMFVLLIYWGICSSSHILKEFLDDNIAHLFMAFIVKGNIPMLYVPLLCFQLLCKILPISSNQTHSDKSCYEYAKYTILP